MNNKGFTLIELLATIVILGIIMGIASYSVINTINKSKLKSEKIFVNKIETAIQEYLSLKGSTISKKTEGINISFNKCRTLNNEETCDIKEAWELKEITMNDITEEGLKTINKNNFINPKNKLNCLDNKNPSIKIYKDSDYVYYYYADLTTDKTSCNITEEIGIISNIPEKMCNSIKENAYDKSKGMCLL